MTRRPGLPVFRCGVTTEKLPSGIRVRTCRNRVRTWGEKCWQHDPTKYARPPRSMLRVPR